MVANGAQGNALSLLDLKIFANTSAFIHTYSCRHNTPLTQTHALFENTCLPKALRTPYCWKCFK